MDIEQRMAALDARLKAQEQLSQLQQDAINKQSAALKAAGELFAAFAQINSDTRINAAVLGSVIAEVAILNGMSHDDFSRMMSMLLDVGEGTASTVGPKTGVNVLKSFDGIRSAAEAYFAGRALHDR